METVFIAILTIGAIVLGAYILFAVACLFMALSDLLKSARDYWVHLTIFVCGLFGSAVLGGGLGALVGLTFGAGMAVVIAVAHHVAVLLWKDLQASAEAKRWLARGAIPIAKWNALSRKQRVAILIGPLFLLPLVIGALSDVYQWSQYMRPAKVESIADLPPGSLSIVSKGDDKLEDGEPNPADFETHSDYVEAVIDWRLRVARFGKGRSAAKLVHGKLRPKPRPDDFETHRGWVRALADWKIDFASRNGAQNLAGVRPALGHKPKTEDFKEIGAFVEALFDWKIAQAQRK